MVVSHWRTLTISVSCAPAAASASATLRQACLASSAKSSGSVPSGRSPGVPDVTICSYPAGTRTASE
jgi:hypothetical protein